MFEILNTLKFGLMAAALVLGISCIVMAFISDKSGAQALQERIEYGFMGVSGLVIFGLLAYALS
jgi:ABC-type Fe3+ transport system permease subunit